MIVALALALPAAPAAGTAQEPHPPALAEQEPDARLDWWREARFGLFIHWGLYAIPAGEWGGQTHHGEWIRHTAQIPIHEYDRLVDRFDPVRFDAEEWVRIAKHAGMKYIVITSKHHDGFALFDSAVSDYDVMATPFRRDILAELAEACRKEGLRICWYHSIMDWHHPDYLPRRGWEDRPADGADLARYVEYLHGQVTELLTNYGPIGVMWFDGEWEATWTHDHGRALYALCRRLQPDVVVNNRVDKGRGGMAGMTTGDQFLGDFGTPEQEIPATGLPGVDWETCMTMNRHWGYNSRDLDYKSSDELIRMLVDIASKGGNFLLNVGPRADGSFPPESVERLEAIGRWMAVHGESIHGTTASPFESLPWGRCTVKRRGADATLYIHVFAWPEDGRILLPGLGSRVRGARLLGAEEVEITVDRKDADVFLGVPAEAPDPACSVVAVEIQGAPLVYRTPRILSDSPILVDSLEVAIDGGSPDVELRYTVDGRTPDAGSPIYKRPIEIAGSTTVKARAFHRGKPVSAVAEASFERVVPHPAVPVDGVEPGLEVETWSGSWDALPDLGDRPPAETWVSESVTLPNEEDEFVLHRFRGYLRVPETEVYRFSLTSDDGSRLWIGEVPLVDNDGLHSSETRTGVMALGEGWHPIRVEWFNKTGGAVLDLRWAPVGSPLESIAPASLGRVAR